MILRKAQLEDINAMLEMVYQGQESLKAMGVNQWQNNYPNMDVVQRDVEKGNAYVLTEDGHVIAMSTVIFNDEPTYERIYEGQWLSRGDFVVIHRVAVNNRYQNRGIASYMIGEIEKMVMQAMIPSIKIDTHKDNLPMRKVLEKSGYIYCGRIVLLDGNSRVAYEKLL